MTDHATGTRAEHDAARAELLTREKELTRAADDLARLRRELPWVPVEKEYAFDTEHGRRTLPELFEGRSQLMVYHFMFGPAYAAGCPVCSSGADTYDGAVAHLNARDVTFACCSRAPLDRLLAYRERMGWSFPWVSAVDGAFSADFGLVQSQEQLRPFLESGSLGPVPGLAAACGTDPAGYLADGPAFSAFALVDGVPHLTYATGARGLEFLLGYYGILDRAPRGRDEAGQTEMWVRRHDEYRSA